MHTTCKRWLEYCMHKYPEYFNDCNVLEMGSMNINDSVRVYFENCNFIGVDWREGPLVDKVSLAHEVRFNRKKFKTIISCNMLEHDPYWDKSLTRMMELLEDSGALFLEWGGPKNKPHQNHTAPDGKFHPLKGELVFDYLTNKGLYIHEFGSEDSFMRYLKLGSLDLSIAVGCFNLIAFKEEYKKTGQLILRTDNG